MKIDFKIRDIKYYVNPNKKTVVCVIDFFERTGQTFRVKGKSKCSDEDTFNEVIGKRIAESRAKTKMYKTISSIYYELFNMSVKLSNELLSKFNNSKALVTKEMLHTYNLITDTNNI